MAANKGRITHKIAVPSHALSQFLRKVVFDEDTFCRFMENSAGTLRTCGVELDSSVSEEALTRLRFLVVRAHDYVVKEKIDSARFEQIFGIAAVNPRLQDIKLKAAAMVKADATVDVYYSEQQSESNRGASTEWKNQDAISESRSDHWSTTKFDGRELLRPEDRFIRVPLLDAFTLGTIVAKVESQLKQLGNY